MVHAWVSRHSIDRGLSATEAAPNSYTGSGQAALPRTDGVPSVPPQPPGRAKVRAPETSPCHALAKQSGELDPAGDAPRAADPSPHRERRKAWASLSRSASAQLGVCSTRGQPRWIQCALRATISDHGVGANPSGRGRAWAAREPRDRCPTGLLSKARSPLCAPVRRAAPHAGPSVCHELSSIFLSMVLSSPGLFFATVRGQSR